MGLIDKTKEELAAERLAAERLDDERLAAERLEAENKKKTRSTNVPVTKKPKTKKPVTNDDSVKENKNILTEKGTLKLLNKIVYSEKLENRKYTFGDAIKEATILLAKKKNIK